MKKLFLSLVVLLTATMSLAQNTLVATLTHGEDITMYYGTFALRDAVNAAESGDIINLSGGAFQAVNITKGVSLRGTGIDDAYPTYITGDFTVDIPTDDANRLSMEGIRCSGQMTMAGTFSNAYFLKCQISSINHRENAAVKNTMFADSKITSDFHLRGSSTVQFINSYISTFYNSSYKNTGALFMNCMIYPYNGSSVDYIEYSQLLNCIIFSSGWMDDLSSTSIATNCLAISSNDNVFDSQAANTDNYNATFEEVFKTFTGSYSEAELFELTDEAKAKFLGNDGTEVGWHGGVLPYNSTPSYPQITKMNVANKTTADGKLSVEIEVSAAQ